VEGGRGEETEGTMGRGEGGGRSHKTFAKSPLGRKRTEYKYRLLFFTSDRNSYFGASISLFWTRVASTDLDLFPL
jgi:hypothetical protein